MYHMRKITLEVLLTLKYLLENPEGLCYGYRLQKETGMSSGAVSQILNRLKASRFVEKEICPVPKGRPRVIYTLTPRGREKAFELLSKVQL